MKYFLSSSLTAFFCFIFGAVYLLSPLDKKNQTKLVVDIPPGQTFYQLAHHLKKQKVIKSAKNLKILIWLWGRPHLKRGEYELSPSMSLWTIFHILKEGKERVFKVSFPEGFNHYEMKELLKSHNYFYHEEFLKQVWNKALVKKLLREERISLEGYLFPDSYYLKKYLQAEKLIYNMFDNFLKNYGEVKANTLELKLTKHQVVTLASLIEKETGLAKERPLISSVFFNRLKKKMKLQTDPTILYALYLVKGFGIEKNIRKKDILFRSPYNTYVIKGLPPGPIANPGKESLRAVFYPDQSPYLYFVSRNDGSHQFSTNYKDHKKAVYKYQIQKK